MKLPHSLVFAFLTLTQFASVSSFALGEAEQKPDLHDDCVSQLTAGFLPDPKAPEYEGSDIVVLNDSIPFSAENGIRAFKLGYFPYYNHRTDKTNFWENPAQRGVLPLSRFYQRITRLAPGEVRTESDPKYDLELRKDIRSLFSHGSPFRVTVNTAFADVLRHCQEEKHKKKIEIKDENGKVIEVQYLTVETTWITPEIAAYYLEMNQRGHAYTVEVWNGDRLVAGILGIHLDGVVSGETSFHSDKKEDQNAGKLAVFSSLMLFKQMGYEWVDAQTVSGLTKMFGGHFIPREEFNVLYAQAAATQETRPWLFTGALNFEKIVDDETWGLLNADKNGLSAPASARARIKAYEDLEDATQVNMESVHAFLRDYRENIAQSTIDVVQLLPAVVKYTLKYGRQNPEAFESYIDMFYHAPQEIREAWTKEYTQKGLLSPDVETRSFAAYLLAVSVKARHGRILQEKIDETKSKSLANPVIKTFFNSIKAADPKLLNWYGLVSLDDQNFYELEFRIKRYQEMESSPRREELKATVVGKISEFNEKLNSVEIENAPAEAKTWVLKMKDKMSAIQLTWEAVQRKAELPKE